MRSLLVAALIGLAAALFAPTAANAATCWQRVIEDWRDGRIDNIYPIHCYRDALKHLPEDLRVYGSAESDLENALARSMARSTTQTERVLARKSAPGDTATAAPTRTRAEQSGKQRALADHRAKQQKPRVAAGPVANATPSRFPVALAVWAGLALVAVAVVAASLRRHVRLHSRSS
jgi:hypothetical protein